MIVRYRYAKSGNNGGQKIDLTVELRQGTTVIASASHSNISGTWTAGSITLTAQQRAAITSWADLRLRFSPVASGGGQARSGQVSWFRATAIVSLWFSHRRRRLRRWNDLPTPQASCASAVVCQRQRWYHTIVDKTTVYLPSQLKSAVRRAALRRGISEAEVIRESIRRAVGDERPRPRGGLFASGRPIAREADDHLRGFGER